MSAATASRPAANQMVTGANGASELQAQSQEPKKVTNQVLNQVEELRARGALTLPADYNVGNALNAAWLKLQTVQDKERRPIIKGQQVDTSIVTLTSVANALHDYVIQGLNCAKNQAYFIVYGNQLVCQRSYFGDMLVAERAHPGARFYFDTIRKGEDFGVEKVWSKLAGLINTVSVHKTSFPRDPEIVGAYCGVIDTRTGENLGMTLMDMPRIRKSWSKSKMPTTQNEFPEEMALRTVVRHRCKFLINSSTDALLMQSMRRQHDDMIEAEIAEESATYANSEALSLPAPDADALDESTRAGMESDVAQEAGF